jgi:hypothetical protein
MPPWYYPWARLSSRERLDLIRGLEAIQPARSRREGRRGRELECERS